MKSPDEVADLGNHVGEGGVTGDIEGNPQEEVGAALIELAAERPVRDVELEQGMTRGRAMRCSSPGFQAETISRRESGFPGSGSRHPRSD